MEDSFTVSLASIPSPGFDSFSVGPLDFTLYGLTIGLGVAAAVWLMGQRLAKADLPAQSAATLATWAVPAGLIGARIAHVATDWHRFEGQWLDTLKIWEGGLGILGGIIAGTAVGIWKAGRLQLPIAAGLDAAAPALALGQAIGRWGNWFNQELFGKATGLPWGLEIDPQHTPSGFEPGTLFHPTFLYESLWNFGAVALLIWVGNKDLLQPGRLFALYLTSYAVGRLWIESLRIDQATELFGARINLWIYAVVLAGSLVLLVLRPRQSVEPA